MAKPRSVINEFQNYRPASGDVLRSDDSTETKENAFSFEDKLADDQALHDKITLVEDIPVSQIHPDLLQPRPSPLPRVILTRLRRNEITPLEAAKGWLKAAEEDVLVRHTVGKYINMGRDIASNGQIVPITCFREIITVGESQQEIYYLETGEQRFWSVLLYHLQNQKELQNLHIRAIIELETSQVDEVQKINRQISENRKNMKMTEVLQAREIARLLLATLSKREGTEFPVSPEDEYEYFRNILKLDRRIPTEVWDELRPIFQLTRQRMAQSIAILKLPSDLLDTANRAGLSYRTLHQVLQRPEEEWSDAIHLAASEAIALEENESGEETHMQPVYSDARKERQASRKTPADQLAFWGIRRFARAAAQQKNELFMGQVADAIYETGQAPATVQALEILLTELHQRLAAQ
jgi:hypothetical protein